MWASSRIGLAPGSEPFSVATRFPSFGRSGATMICMSESAKPAAFNRAAMASAAAVQLPEDRVVLISISSL
jgi:hypothetical protein